MLRFLILITAALLGASPAMAQVSVPPTVSLVEGQPWSVPVQRPVGTRKSTTISFSWRTIPDTATAGLDFTVRSGNQSIRKNTTKITLSGGTTDDTLFENDERFIVEVTVPGHAPFRTVVVLRDNDPAPAPPAQLAVNDGACREGDPCVVTFSRSGGDLSKAATFDWFTAPGGTAIAGTDYVHTSGRLTFAPGSATAPSATFPTIENTVDAPDKTIMVGIKGLDAPVAVPQHPTNLLDDDEAPPPPPPPVPCPDGTTVPAGQTCPVPPPPPPSADVWTFCNHNNFTCFHEGTGKVRWGSTAKNDWTVIEPVTGSIDCSQETFRREKPTVGGYHCETTAKPTVLSYVAPPPGTPGFVPMPTPDGEVPVNQSEGDLVPTSVVADNSAVPDVLGAMRFFCRAGQIKRVDPIVSPGKPSAHWHQFFGWTEMDPFDTYQSLQTEPGYSTCNYPPPAGVSHLQVPNHSGYWISAMIVTVPTGSSIPPKTLTLQPGQPVIGGVMTKPTEHFWVPDGNTLYYKRRPSTDPACKGVSPWGPQYLGCVPITHGLKMLFGFDMVKLLDSESPMTFRCIDAAGVQRGPMGPRLKDALADCPAGSTMHQKIEAQHCKDPAFIDTPNHMDHLSYAMQKLGTGQGGCKPTRSGAYQLDILPHLTLLTSYAVTQAVVDAYKADPEWGVRLSSDDHLRMLRPKEAWAGKTGHADAFLSWLAKVRDRWNFGGNDPNGVPQKGCIEGLKNCSAGQTGTGWMQRGGGAPWYPSAGRTLWDHPNNLVPVREEGYSAEW